MHTLRRPLTAVLSLLLVAGFFMAMNRLTAEAVTKNDLKNAWVPSMCNHPAGHLVGGALPEDGDPSNGGVWLVKTALGPLAKGPKIWGVSVLSCTAGGVSWPDNVVVYKPNGKFVKRINLSKIFGTGREGVTQVKVVKRTVWVRVGGINQGDEAACCGTATAQLTFKWKAGKKRLVLKRKKVYTERQAAKKLVKLVRKGKLKKARKHGSRKIVQLLASYRKERGRLIFDRCYGEFDNEFQWGPGGFSRICTVEFKQGKRRFIVAAMGMKQKNWRKWKAMRV